MLHRCSIPACLTALLLVTGIADAAEDSSEGTKPKPVQPEPAPVDEASKPSANTPAPAADGTAPSKTAPSASKDKRPEKVDGARDTSKTTVLTIPTAEVPEAGASPHEAEPKQDAPWQGGRFRFGSYGRVLAAGNSRGRPVRDGDIVSYGSRLDLPPYAELELRREDRWQTGIGTEMVATLAVGHPVFHYDANFDAQVALRNLYVQARELGLDGLDAWAGSRMLRGDDIYLLDWWPLDNLNTLGGGLSWTHRPSRFRASVHVGAARPDHAFYKQVVSRPAPLDQFGSADVAVLDRQRWVASGRLEKVQTVGTDGAGLKFVLYGEAHELSAGEKQTEQPEVYEPVGREQGFVLGGQVGFFTGQRDTHVNLFIRHASGLAAYGAFAAPSGLGIDRTTAGAFESLIALSGNVEFGPFGLMAAGYLRQFRNASEGLDFGDVDEAMAIARPQVFLNEWLGLAVEGTYQVQRRGVLRTVPGDGDSGSQLVAQDARLGRVAVMPFVSPAGRGSFKRPMLFLLYQATVRDDGARALYPDDDPFARDGVDHVFGLGAEWWFNSSSYGSP